MATAEQALTALQSIDASLKRLVEIAEKRVATRESSAPKVDLDGPHGDPIVKAKDPRDWMGDPMQGRHFSECPAAYLDLVAERLDYFNVKETDEKKKGYNALDAALARGWAARIRAGYKPPVVETPMVKEDEIAF